MKFNPKEWHHGYIGIIFFVGAFFVEHISYSLISFAPFIAVIGIIIIGDEILQILTDK